MLFYTRVVFGINDFQFKCVVCDISLIVVDDDFDGGVDEALDIKGLSKRDMHTLNEQRRRDSIKVRNACLLLE